LDERGLTCLGEVKIPRWMGGGNRCRLYMCCDANADSSAAAVFLRAESTEGVTVQLMQAKCRVAPLNKLIIPRLELLAATFGDRLFQSLIGDLCWKQRPVYLWSDSTKVVYFC
jgi:hypothetical protein